MAVKAAAWLAVLATLGVALIASARGSSAPAGWTLVELREWYDARPVSAVFRLGATGALVVVLYLMVSTIGVLMASAARAAQLPRLDRIAQLVAVPAVRRSLSGVLGVGIGLTVGMPSTSVHATASPTVTASEPEGIATMQTVDDGPDELPPVSTDTLGHAPDRQWVIRSGDHLWGLAEATLTNDLGRLPTDLEVAGLVRAVVDLNGPAFVVPGHPDLVYPGQVFVLPT
jgi:hypothetical protein